MFRRKHAHGITEVLELAIELHGDAVYRFALLLLKSPEDAEDVFQVVFADYLNRIREGTCPDTSESARRVLLKITATCCMDARYRARQSICEDTSIISEIDDPQAIAHRDLMVLDAVEKLPVAMRAAVHLRYFEGYSPHEIAQITGEKDATIRSRLMRARNALASRLQGGIE